MALVQEWRKHGALQIVLRSRFVRPWIVRAYEIIYWHSYTWTGTKWLGVLAMKYPADAWAYQEILFETKPELIIETGTYRGGSAFFLATICDALGIGRIVTVDSEPPPTDQPLPEHPRIKYIVGSSIDPTVLQQLRLETQQVQRVMVILDSDHRADHVYQELLAYQQFVTPGCYLVCEDTNVNGHPVYRAHGPGPMEALDRFLPEFPDFTVDRTRERAGISAHPRGFLRRDPRALGTATRAS